MLDDKKERQIKIEHAGITGPIWFMGWLFCLGFLKLTFFKALLAIIVWPYYLGSALAS